MPLPSSLIVGQLRLVGGVPQDDPLTVSVFEPRSFLRRHDPGIVFILIDLLADTPDDEALLSELMHLVRETYDQARGSVTRRLRQSVLAANRYLRRWNRQRRDSRQAAGISCVTLVGDEAYLAQAGPALVYVAQPGALERYPDESPWLSERPLESMPQGIWTPLGVRDEVYVDLSFARIGPGYTLCLISAHTLQFLGEDELVRLLDQDPENVLRDLSVFASGQNLSALVIGLGEPEREVDTAAPATAPPPQPASGVGARATTAGRRALMAVGSAGAGVLGGIARILEGMLPEPVGEDDETLSERRRLAYMWLAVVIPLALILLTAALYWTRGLDQQTRSRDLIASVSARVEEARSVAETNPEQAQALLQSASEDLNQAENLQPEDNPEQLRTEIQAQLERIRSIVRLPQVVSVASLPGTADDRRRLIVQGTSAFVFNAREQVIHRIGLGDQRIVEVLRTEEERGGRSVGPLVDVAWVPPGGVREQGAVVALDSTGTAWQIDGAGNVVPLVVADSERWRGLRLVGGFAGNLYVLDVSLGQILKYPPTVDGYAIPPVDWLAADADVTLSDVVDLSIDGSIYLFRSNGNVEKLVAGSPAPFDQPDEFDLTQPVACFAASPSGHVFLADTTRVLQFDADGRYQRQLLPPDRPWERLSALWVDEANGWLYTVDAGTLVRAPLPAQ